MFARAFKEGAERATVRTPQAASSAKAQSMQHWAAWGGAGRQRAPQQREGVDGQRRQGGGIYVRDICESQREGSSKGAG